MTTEPVERVDALGLLCPLPILRIAAAIKRAEVGDIVELVGDDEGILEDLPAWCEGERHELVWLEGSGTTKLIGRVRKLAPAT